jgi:hypothetical protein
MPPRSSESEMPIGVGPVPCQLRRISLPKLSGKSGCAPKWGSEGGQEGSKRPRWATSQRPITTIRRPQVIFQTVSPRPSKKVPERRSWVYSAVRRKAKWVEKSLLGGPWDYATDAYEAFRTVSPKLLGK